jgi:hypothetical protein
MNALNCSNHHIGRLKTTLKLPESKGYFGIGSSVDAAHGGSEEETVRG